VASDLGLVVYATQAHANKLPAQRPRDRFAQRRFPHARRADQQDVGGVFEEPQRAELVDQGAVDARLGVDVVVGEPPGSGEAGEPFQAGQAADLGGGHLDVEESFQEGGVAELLCVGVFEGARECFGGGAEAEVGEMGAEFLVDGRLAHRPAPSAMA